MSLNYYALPKFTFPEDILLGLIVQGLGKECMKQNGGNPLPRSIIYVNYLYDLNTKFQEQTI